MNVLVGCEYSGRVREAFRKRGHNAVSCDLLPAEDASPHHIQDGGNPYKVSGDITQKKAVQLYAEGIIPYRHKGDKSSLHHFLLSVANIDDIKHSLRGKNLACWCRLDQPCHADVLLEIANHE